MKKIDSMEALFIEQLSDVYDAENQLLKALPKMAEKASSEALKSAFQEHLEQTKEHVSRLDEIFKHLQIKNKSESCEGMEGLIKEANKFLKLKSDPSIIDAALIASAQRVEHYEIAAYGCLTTYANLLLDEEASNFLHQTLEEEKETDQKLTNIAEANVNIEAEIGVQ